MLNIVEERGIVWFQEFGESPTIFGMRADSFHFEFVLHQK